MIVFFEFTRDITPTPTIIGFTKMSGNDYYDIAMDHIAAEEEERRYEEEMERFWQEIGIQEWEECQDQPIDGPGSLEEVDGSNATITSPICNLVPNLPKNNHNLEYCKSDNDSDVQNNTPTQNIRCVYEYIVELYRRFFE